LERILKGEGTFKSLENAYAANPKDVAAAFGLARKWNERSFAAKAVEKYKEVIALDPEGKAGPYADERMPVRAPYAEYAKLYLARMESAANRSDPKPLRAFVAGNPGSVLVKLACVWLADIYDADAFRAEGDAFFEDMAARTPDDPDILSLRLSRIIRSKGPAEKAAALAERLRNLTASRPDFGIRRVVALAYDLAGDRIKAAEAYGASILSGPIAASPEQLVDYSEYWIGKNENLQSAVAAAEAALTRRPDEFYFLLKAAAANLTAGNAARALELFGPTWLEKNTAAPTAYDVRSYAAFWLQQGKNLESALAAARRAVAIDPTYYACWLTLSDVLAKLGRKAEAIAAAEKAVEVAPASAKAAAQKKLDALK